MKAIEKKLQKEFGKQSSLPHKIMDRLGIPRGKEVKSKEEKREERVEKEIFGNTYSK